MARTIFGPSYFVTSSLTIIFNLNRDISLKQTTMNRLEELQNELKLESKQRLENEVEMRTSLEGTNTKMKMYCDESVEAARQITVVNYYFKNAPFHYEIILLNVSSIQEYD